MRKESADGLTGERERETKDVPYTYTNKRTASKIKGWEYIEIPLFAVIFILNEFTGGIE